MRSSFTPLLLAAALAGSAGLASAQTSSLNGSARIDGTGAGINAGAGATISGTPGSNTMTPAPTTTLGAGANDTRVLGSGPRAPGNVVPDNLPGTMDPRNATVGVNGTGTLDGGVRSDEITNDGGVNGSLGGGGQR